MFEALHFLAVRVRHVCSQERKKERESKWGRAFSLFMLGTRAGCWERVCMFWKRKKCGDPALSRGAEAFERVYQVNNEDMFALRRVLLCFRSFLHSKWKTPFCSFCKVPKRWNFQSYIVLRSEAKTNSLARFKLQFLEKCQNLTDAHAYWNVGCVMLQPQILVTSFDFT